MYFDFEIQDLDGPGDIYTGRVVIGLFGEVAPVTCTNFAAIARGYKTPKRFLHYKGTPVHRVVIDLCIQMGDITMGDGNGGFSIYAKTFPDENFDLKHSSAGMVGMANAGPDSNSSQFYILLQRARWLDNKHVVFGKVVRGMDVVNTIGEIPTDDHDVPLRNITISDCGLVDLASRYKLSPKQIRSNEDL